MNDIELIPKIQKFIKTNHTNIADAMVAGGVDNMEKYKYMLGQAAAYQIVIQEISNLQKEDEKEQKNEVKTDIENIIRFDATKN